MTSKGDQVDMATQMTNGKNGIKNADGRSEDKGLDRFFELSLDLLCVADTNGYFKQLNPAFENTLGWSIEELLSKPFMEFVHADDIPATAAEIEKLAQGALTINFENRFVCKDGSFKWLSWNAQPTEDGRLYAVARNVTEQKHVKETLSKQATDLAKVAQLSTTISSLTDPGEMLQKVVDLTKQSFNLYHAHIYLLDEASTSLRLAAGADSVGRQMVADGWRIPLSRPDSLVAKTASTRQGGIINNVQQDIDHLPNPRLPKTKSELVVPIIVSDEVLGVLDIQSDKFDFFTEDDLNIQTSLAAQIGVALVNARSFERSTQAVEDLDRLTRQLTKEGWRDHLESGLQPNVGYVYDLNRVVSTNPETNQNDNNEWALTQNLTVHGETIGRLDLTQPESLTDDAAEIVKAVTDRLSNHLENLRLTEQLEKALAETEREAHRLSLLNEMSTQLNQAASEGDVFQLAAKFAPMIVQADETSIALLNDSGDMIEIIALKGEQGAVPQGKVMPLKATNFERAVRERRLIVQHESREDPALPGLVSRMHVPLIAGGKLIGVLNVGNKKAFAYSAQDENMLFQTAALVASALESRRLLAEVQRLAAIVENHPDFIGIGTLDGKTLYVNPSGLKMIGLPPDHDVTTIDIPQFYPAEEAEQLVSKTLPAALAEGSWISESRLLKVDGSPIPVEQTLAINYDPNGQPYSFSLTLRDITERKNIEAERQRLLEEVQEAYSFFVYREWGQYLSETHHGRLRFEHQETGQPGEPLPKSLTESKQAVFQDKRTKISSPLPGEPGEATVVAPISLRGTVIGALGLQDLDPNRQWTNDEIALVETVSEQLALTVENLRLVDSTRKQAAREQLTREIADKMRAAPDIDAIIQTGLTELAKTLGVSRSYVKLTTKDET